MTKRRYDMAPSSAPPAPIPLDPTGVPGLDEVLGGGIQRGSLAIIAGPPGGGKTILAHQIAFAAARMGRRTAVLTAFSEPTNKLIAHMRPFAFFEQDLLGESLDILSIQQFLAQGLAQATEAIIGAVRAANAQMVVLDGFRGVRETAEHPEDARRFVYDVSNRLSLLGITLLLTSEANVRDAAFFPEATTADVLLGLAFDAIGTRERRTLEVLKARGASPLTGQHAVTIGDEGVTIYPRLEARMARLTDAGQPLRAPAAPPTLSLQIEQTARAADDLDVVSTGVVGLDALLDGGLARGGSALVVGGRGAGKTLLGLQFALQGAQTGQPSVFVSFRETAGQLRRRAAPFEWAARLERALQARTLTILRTLPVELRADVFADSLLSVLDETRARRLVLDGLGEVEHALAASGYTHRFHDFVAALVEALRLRGVTALLTCQVAAERRSALEDQLGAAATLTEYLIWLRLRLRGTHLERSLVLLETAGPVHPNGWHQVTIQPPEGIAVGSAVGERQVPRERGDAGSGDEVGRRGGMPRRPYGLDEESAR